MALFFVSSLLLPYIPTILASALVLFLGIELTLEAIWESTKTLLWTEWIVVITTLVACTSLGFAPGVGVGIGAAIVVYLFWGIADNVSTRKVAGNTASANRHLQRARSVKLDDCHNEPMDPCREQRLRSRAVGSRFVPSVNYVSKPDLEPSIVAERGDLRGHGSYTSDNSIKLSSGIRIIELCGYVCKYFFTTLEI